MIALRGFLLLRIDPFNPLVPSFGLSSRRRARRTGTCARLNHGRLDLAAWRGRFQAEEASTSASRSRR
jgi:hypothetical protein